MHPQTATATTQMSASSLQTARLDAQARANRSLTRTRGGAEAHREGGTGETGAKETGA